MSTYKSIYAIFNNRIPIKTFTMVCRVQTPVSFPPYAGSVIRGILGHGLKKLRINDAIAHTLSDMDQYKICPYRMVFEPPQLQNPIYGVKNIPVPYVIVPPLGKKRLYQEGEQLCFGITLMGNAIDKLPYIIHAFDMTLQHGIGTKNPHGETGTAHMQSVVCDNRPIWHTDDKNILPYTPYIQLENDPDTTYSTLQLAIDTPLRLQKQGVLITKPHLITAENVLMSAIRRVCALLTIHTDTDIHIDFKHLRHLAQHMRITHNLTFHNWTRYSNRQQQAMDLGGWVGNMVLQGDITPFVPYMQLAEYTHIGKNTAFGLGKITIQDIHT